jgi:polar amino acid transport system substrate-binding protein
VVTENSSWLSTIDAQGNIAGRNTQLVKDILARAGLKADFQVLPWARAYRMAATRPNTLIYSIARTSTRESQFIWLGQIATCSGVLSAAWRNRHYPQSWSR